MAATRLDITHSSAGNRQIMTFSFWCKISSLINPINASYYFPVFHMNVGSDYTLVDFTNNNQLRLLDYNGTDVSTNRKFTDVNAWYAITVAIDTTQATASNRVKMYVNGVQETSLATSTYPAQNANMSWNNNNLNSIGQHSSATDYYYIGLLSHVHFIDGIQYQASDFGQYDANGVWTIKTSPSVTYGTNGFFILKDGNSVTDQSGNSNNFTLATGSLVNTEDCPSNVFATLNPLETFPETDYSNGNTKSTRSTGSYRSAFSTLGFTTGKYYAEFKVYDVANGNGLGVLNLDKSPYGTYISGTEKYVGINDNAVGLFSNILYYNNVNQGGTWTSWSNGDIIGLAVDATNGYAYWSVNGTWQNSGNPTAGTGGYALSNIGSNGTYVMGCSNSTSSTEVNFGNGYFGTTAVASAGTNASGNGIFEFDCPVGYTALSTKGLNL